MNTCNTYNWAVNNTTYTTGGLYTYTTTNILGCVHIDTLILEIKQNTTSYDSINSCDSYTWNNQILTSTGIYDSIFTNSQGCDSIAVLELYINNSSIDEFYITECNEFTWDGITYINSGYITRTYQNQIGCDSIVNINLTIINSSLAINANILKQDVTCYGKNDGAIQLFINGGNPPYIYSWNNGDITNYIDSLPSGLYSFVITDSIGCKLDSSVIITEPEKIEANIYIEQDTICEGEEIEVNIDILKPKYNLYTIIITDSIEKTYIIDSSGIQLLEQKIIKLSPKSSRNINLISITDEAGCSNKEVKNDSIIVHPTPNISLTLTDICVGENSFHFPVPNTNIGEPIGGIYLINNERTTLFDVENLENGAYIVQYKYTDSITSCFNQIQDTINIFPSPKTFFKLSPQPTDINDPNIYFEDKSNGNFKSTWDLGDGNYVHDSLKFWHTYNDTGKYIITYIVENQFLCTDTMIDSLIIHPYYEIFIPEAFTPDNNKINDLFYPIFSDSGAVKEYQIIIYDKWGGEIFNKKNTKWNGKLNGEIIPTDRYSYLIRVIDFKEKEFKYTGIIQLIR